MASARKLISRKKEIVSQIKELQQELKDDVYDQCHCPEKHRDTKSDYRSGSYDTKASTFSYEVCQICGKWHNQKETFHDWFS